MNDEYEDLKLKKLSSLIYENEINRLNAEIEQLVGALKQIAKLKSSPDDGVNKYILFMAITTARVAIGVNNDE